MFEKNRSLTKKAPCLVFFLFSNIFEFFEKVEKIFNELGKVDEDYIVQDFLPGEEVSVDCYIDKQKNFIWLRNHMCSYIIAKNLR